MSVSPGRKSRRSHNLSDDITDIAARGVSEADEVEYHALYEMDMQQCETARVLSMAHWVIRRHSAMPLRFNYVPDVLSENVEQLAASTNSPKFAAKMLGYDQKTFGKMIHVMKQENQLRGNDNVVWHDNGDISSKGVVIDNMHGYAP